MGLLDVCWSARLGLYVAVGSDNGTNTGLIMTSPDGASWTARSYPAGDLGIGVFVAVCYSPELGLFAAFAWDGAVYIPIYTSSDGINWTKNPVLKTLFASGGGGAVTCKASIWIAEQKMFLFAFVAGGSLRFAYSSDGLTWHVAMMPVASVDTNYHGFAWSPALSKLVYSAYSATYYSEGFSFGPISSPITRPRLFKPGFAR